MRNQYVIFSSPSANIDNTDEKMLPPPQEHVELNSQSSILSEPSQVKNEVLKGRREGCTNYTNKKLRLLINIINIHMPYGADQWQIVADAYNQAAKENRTAKSVKDKFYELVRARKPTGEGEKSRLIEDAQRLHDDITVKFNGSVIASFPANPSSSSSSSTATSTSKTPIHIIPPTDAVMAAAAAANNLSFDSNQFLSDSPRSFTSSPSASPSSCSSEMSTSRKRKLEDAILTIAENACKKSAMNETVLVTVLDKMMGTMERMQKQQQEWIEHLLLKHTQTNKSDSVS